MNLALYSIIAVWGLIILAFSFGSIVLAVTGIVLLRKKRIFAGGIVASIGFMGLLFSAMMVVFACYAFYMLKKSPAFNEARIEQFDPSKYTGKTGTIIFPFKGESILTESDPDKNIQTEYSSNDGVFKIPAGSHNFISYELRVSDPKGNRWEACSWDLTDFDDEITLSENSLIELKAGPPFIIKVLVKEKSDGSVSLSFDCRDGRGNEFSLYPAESKSVSSPGFEVFSEAGVKVWSGDFKYG